MRILKVNELNESQKVVVYEPEEVKTSDILPELEKLEMDDEDINIFANSGNKKTLLILRHYYDDYEDLKDLLKRCDGIYDVYELKVGSTPEELTNPVFWIDMGNGLNNLAIMTNCTRTFTDYKIYSGQKNLTDFLLFDLEKTIEIENNANKYNV